MLCKRGAQHSSAGGRGSGQPCIPCVLLGGTRPFLPLYPATPQSLADAICLAPTTAGAAIAVAFS